MKLNPFRTAMVASAAQVPAGDLHQLRRKEQPWQQQAWRLWRVLGVLHYPTSFMAEQVMRLDWKVSVGDKDLSDDQSKEAIGAITEPIGAAEVARRLALNLEVVGEVYYGRRDDEWKTISPTVGNLQEKLERLDPRIRGWLADPEDPSKPDSPVRAALDTAEEIRVMSALMRAQTRNRLAQRGILLFPGEMEFPEGDDFFANLQGSMTAPIQDEYAASAVVPLYQKMPGEYIEKVKHLVLDFPYDEKLDERLDGAIKRLALSLNMPPEILLGLADVNRWNAFIIEDCLVPETPVLTADLRWVPVGDLKVDDELAAFDEHSEGRSGRRQWRRSRVEKVGRAMRDCYEVELSDGTRFVASAGHQWLYITAGCRRDWVTTEWLYGVHRRRNGRRAGPNTGVQKVIEPWSVEDSWRSGYLAGVFDGEGWLSARRENGQGLITGFSQRENEVSRLTETLAVEMGFDLGQHRFKNSRSGQSNYPVRGGAMEVARFLGQVRPQRLLRIFEQAGGPECLGELRGLAVNVVSVTPVGKREVVTLRTSTGTVVAEGFAHHNSAYRAHIEPLALNVGSIFAEAIAQAGELENVVVTPDPTELLARKQSIADAFKAFELGILDAKSVREAIGADEDAAPPEIDEAVTLAVRMLRGAPSLGRDPGLEELVRQLRNVLGGSSTPPPGVGSSGGPANAPVTDRQPVRTPDEIIESNGSEEAVTAAVEDDSDAALDKLASQMVDIDTRLISWLDGASEVALSQIQQHAEEADVDTQGLVTAELERLGAAWERKLEGARRSLVALGIEAEGPEWEEAGQVSVDMLTDGLTDHVMENLSREIDDRGPLATPVLLLRRVLAAAGGSETAVVAGVLNPPPTFQDPQGFAIGVLSLKQFEGENIELVNWRFRYGPLIREAPFIEHKHADGQFMTADGFTSDGWAPGDHAGCLCWMDPVLRRRPQPQPVERSG